MPSVIEQVHRDYKDRGLIVLAVDIQEPSDHVASWVRSKKMSMPVLLDAEGAVASAWRVTATPTVFLVGRDGKLVARGVGNRPWTASAGRMLLDAFVAP